VFSGIDEKNTFTPALSQSKSRCTGQAASLRKHCAPDAKFSCQFFLPIRGVIRMSNDSSQTIQLLKQKLEAGEINVDTFITQTTRAMATNTAGGAIAQGEGALAVGAQGVGIGGDNYGNINTGVFINLPEDQLSRMLELAKVTNAATLLAPPLDAARKEEIVQYYNDIAQTLDDSAVILKQRQIPHGKCGELLGYAEHLPAALSDVIGIAQAKEFQKKLIQNYEIEWFGAQYFNLPQSEMEAKFGELEAAAGYFRAAAKALKVKR
jgi:hypothetical protein